MKDSGKKMGRLDKLVMVVTIVATALLSLAGVAQAATPAWKLLAVTGPSNLSPRQSEVQRLTVEAAGGTFRLEHVQNAEGGVTPIVLEADLRLRAGDPVATIESVTGAGTVEPGDRVSIPEGYETTTILSCSADCRTPGSTIELSQPAGATETGALRQIYTKELEVDSGTFEIGETVTRTTLTAEGETFEVEYFPPGTAVVGSVPGRITLSSPPISYDPIFEGPFLPIGLFTELLQQTQPVPFDASAAELQGALTTALGAGSVTVSGGPGGDGGRPYFINFSGADGNGPLANRNVATLEADASELTGETANANVFTTVPGGPGTGEIVVDPVNVGGARSKGLATMRIGPLPQGIRATGAAEGPGWTCGEPAQDEPIECRSSAAVASTHPAEPVSVPVEVDVATPMTSAASITLSGGGAAPDQFQLPIEVSSDPAPFATRAFWAGAFDENGNLLTQAGGHPFSAQTFFILNTVRSKSGQVIPAGVVGNAEVDLPAGFIGDPMVTPRCPRELLAAFKSEGFSLCNKQMIIGYFGPIVERVSEGLEGFSFPIYNDVPALGYPAQFTSKIVTPNQSLLGSLRGEEDFGVTIVAPNIPNFYKIFGSYAALEGRPTGAGGEAFIRNPSDCAEEAVNPPVTKLRMEAYELAGLPPSSSSVSIPSVTGCDKLHFTPSFGFQPSTTQGSSPTGATADLHIPQTALTDPNELAQPDLKKAVVTLPQGLTVNPSSANGVQACTEAQVGYMGPAAMPNPTRFDEEPVTCPDASKLGTFTVKTPLLDETEAGGKLEGTIYLAAQEENPFHSLIALYLVLENERYGLTLKLPGEVTPDPVTGQLTAIFDNNPQLPFEDLTLNFRGGGPRATLATPEVCGHYATTGSLEPWSAPESGPPVQISEGGFDVNSGCSSSDSTRPFAPGFEAGTTGTQAGSYSPLVIKVSRKDGEQELKSLDFTLPRGLTAKLAGIPYCPEGAIQNAEHKSGKAEQESAGCPAASQIGTVDTSAGVGSEPLHVGGKVYLAGPYKGAPLSSVVVTPAVAGPFDLGDVVIRAPLYVDPETAEVTAKSDPIPTILKGIPLKVRSVAIDLDRSLFTLNSTSCNVMEVTSTMQGSSGATAKPANRFQVGGCNKLGFKPKLKVTLKGGTKRTGHPALKAVLTYPKQGAYSNIRRAQVNLPHSEFLDQNNLNKTCTKPVLLEGKCPKKSIYGKAKAWTPLLDEPLQGPVYLVGGYGYKLPALVAELNGQIRVVLKGKVDSGPNKGIRNTFEAVPDAPVSRFVLEMKGGKKYGLLENSEDLCKKPQHLLSRFTAQDGKVLQSKPKIANSCGKKGKGKKQKSKGQGKHSKSQQKGKKG